MFSFQKADFCSQWVYDAPAKVHLWSKYLYLLNVTPKPKYI